MDITDQLRRLPNGWRWGGPAEKYTEWLDRDTFLKFPFAVGSVYPPGAEDSTWILHAQYVCPAGSDPEDIGDVFLGSGFSPKPPAWWRRVSWRDVAAATKADLRGPVIDGREFPPSDLWGAVIDRPLFDATTEDSFLAPSVGSMSQEDLEHLIPILANHTKQTRIFGLPSYMDPEGAIDIGDGGDGRYIFSFDLLNMIKDLLNDSDGYESFTPELWWPQDRSWLIWNDYDLMGTKIFGKSSLIQQIRASKNIETLDWFPLA